MDGKGSEAFPPTVSRTVLRMNDDEGASCLVLVDEEYGSNDVADTCDAGDQCRPLPSGAGLRPGF